MSTLLQIWQSIQTCSTAERQQVCLQDRSAVLHLRRMSQTAICGVITVRVLEVVICRTHRMAFFNPNFICCGEYFFVVVDGTALFWWRYEAAGELGGIFIFQYSGFGKGFHGPLLARRAFSEYGDGVG